MSSKRRQRRKMCGDKVNYASYEAANTAASGIRGKTGDRLFPYGCSFCGGVHLGHPTASKRQSLRARARARREGA